MRSVRPLPLLLALYHATPTLAQFFWGFNTTNSLNIPECATLPVGIFADGTTINSDPPYYMFAYETSGRTTSQLLGTDSSKLTWQVAHPQGSTLLLQIADSTGRSGGVAGMYTVQSGTTDCNEVPTTSSINIATNSTSIDRCSEITFTITGGKGPYNVTIAGENEATVTNITMPSNTNVLNYVNLMTASLPFIVGVADSTGTWAQNTGLIQSTGSNSTTCPNKQNSFSSSSSSTTTSGGQPASSSGAGKGSDNNTGGNNSSGDKGAIVGGVVAGILLIGLAISLAFFFYRRRQRERNGGTRALPPSLDTWDLKHGRNASNGAAAALTNYAALPGDSGHITPFASEPRVPPSPNLGPGSASRRYDSYGAAGSVRNPFGTRTDSVVSYDPYREADAYGGLEGGGTSSAAPGSEYQYGAALASVGAAGTVGALSHSTYPPSQAGTTQGGWADISNHGRSDSTAQSSSSGGGRRRSIGPLMAVNVHEGSAMTEKRQLAERRMREDAEALRRVHGAMAPASSSSIVYQHKDADDIVEELPPAYRDR